jgi:uncharacterized protein
MPYLILASFVIVALASAAQAMTGFGFALLAVPLLAVVADAPTAVVATSLVGLIPTTVTALRDRGHVRWQTVALLLGAAVAGLPMGLLILRGVPERWLTVLIAVIVLGCTWIVWRPPRLPAGRGAVAAVGVLTGVLTTSTGTNGPPLVAVFRAMGYGPRAFRATLATGVLGAVGFALAGAVTRRASLVALVGLPAAVLGWAVGDRIFSRLNAGAFRRVLLAALVACSLLALGRAFVS